jgi:uncharacterized coiled-coil DUF342 family protein
LLEQLEKIRGDMVLAGQENGQLRSQLDDLSKHMNEQDREVSSLQRQLDQTIAERDHYIEQAQVFFSAPSFIINSIKQRKEGILDRIYQP